MPGSVTSFLGYVIIRLDNYNAITCNANMWHFLMPHKL